MRIKPKASQSLTCAPFYRIGSASLPVITLCTEACSALFSTRFLHLRLDREIYATMLDDFLLPTLERSSRNNVKMSEMLLTLFQVTEMRSK
jgi:hypothetical protein